MKVEIELSDKVAAFLTKASVILETSDSKVVELFLTSMLEAESENELISGLLMMKVANDLQERLKGLKENPKSKWQERLEKMQQEQAEKLKNTN